MLIHLSFVVQWQGKRETATLVLEAFLFFLRKFCDANRFFYFFFYWQEALSAEKRKSLVKTIGILTFTPSAFDRRL